MNKIFRICISLNLIRASDSESTHCKKYFEHEHYPSNHTWVAERDSTDVRTRWPWLVSIGGYCAGTLIGPRWVVTAAQCCASPINHDVYIGSNGAVGTKNETFKVVDFRHHEKFNIATVYFDVCLLKLDAPVTLSSKAYPICLASRRSEITSPESQGATAGWSDQTEFGTPSPRILERTLPIRNATTCNNLFHYYDESKMFCAGPVEILGQPECIGDSGAPFVMMEDDRPVLAGITSWGYGCQKGRPLGIHTKIGNIVSWIVNKAIDMGADMDSARRRNHAKPNIQLRFTNNSNSTKSVKKTQKQRRKRIKQRKNVKDQIRKQNLERKFRLKMIHRGQHVETKKLKKFLKSNVKRDGRHQKTYLKSNQIKKLRTVNSAMPVFVYNACSTSGYDERYGSDRTDIEKIKCSYRNDNFECTFKCLQDNMQPNAVIRCRENRWYETFIKDTKNICSPINNIKIRKLSKSSSPQLKSSSSGLSRRHQNRHHQQYQPQVDTRVLSTCFTGTVNEGREQFNQFYVGQLFAESCRLKSNGGFECNAISCINTSKTPTVTSTRCVNGRWTPKKIKCH